MNQLTNRKLRQIVSDYFFASAKVIIQVQRSDRIAYIEFICRFGSIPGWDDVHTPQRVEDFSMRPN
jgi:hypothetical protein